MRSKIKKILREKIEQSSIYHFVDEKKLINVLNKNEMKPKWRHYIESEDRLVTGTSFTWDLNHETLYHMEYPIKMIFDYKQLEQDYNTFLINSQRVYLQTMAYLNPKLYDPNAYKFEDETPNELFVEGTIKPLDKYLIDIELIDSVSKKTKETIDNFFKNH